MRGQSFRLKTPTLDMSKHVRPKTSRKLKTPVKAGQPSPKSKGRKDETKEVTQPDPELVIYERAIEPFNAGRFQAAKDTFAELADARNRDLAHSAELRIRMCEQRLGRLVQP